jgi:type VI secretion system ImpH/TssG family protein
MAAENRTAPQPLTFLQRATNSARRFGVFPLLRAAEAHAPDHPRIGRSRAPQQDVVELVQTPALHFPGPTIDAIDHSGRRPRVSGYWFGLTGPMGALPLHLTEFAVYERLYGRKRPFGRFLDLLSGRMAQFFYRAWADAQPAVSLDRPSDDRFAYYLAMLSGATDCVGDGRAFPKMARLHYAGLFASRRSAAAIQDALSHLLRSEVRVQEFAPRWRAIDPEDRSRLGGPFSRLAGDAVLGGAVRTVTDAFRVVIRARTLRDYETLLPSGPAFRLAAEALNAFAPSHLEWQLELEVPEKEVRPAGLDGRARLGWTSWLTPEPDTPRIRADTRLGRSAALLARQDRGDTPP